jgi:hypothetical protein
VRLQVAERSLDVFDAGVEWSVDTSVVVPPSSVTPSSAVVATVGHLSVDDSVDNSSALDLESFAVVTVVSGESVSAVAPSSFTSSTDEVIEVVFSSSSPQVGVDGLSSPFAYEFW